MSRSLFLGKPADVISGRFPTSYAAKNWPVGVLGMVLGCAWLCLVVPGQAWMSLEWTSARGSIRPPNDPTEQPINLPFSLAPFPFRLSQAPQLVSEASPRPYSLLFVLFSHLDHRVMAVLSSAGLNSPISTKAESLQIVRLRGTVPSAGLWPGGLSDRGGMAATSSGVGCGIGGHGAARHSSSCP